MKSFVCLFILSLVGSLSAQNVGIGTNSPSEKLQVNGIIYSSQGGIRFPDNTIQTTAAYGNNGGAFSETGPLVLTIENSGLNFNGNFNANGFSKAMELESFSYQVKKDISFGSGGLPNVGKAELMELRFVKPVDQTSTSFFDALNRSVTLGKISVYVLKPNLGSATTNRSIQVMVFSNGLVSSIHQLGAIGNVAYEEITMFVETFCQTSYIPSTGPGNDQAISACWNYKASATCTCPTIQN